MAGAVMSEQPAPERPVLTVREASAQRRADVLDRLVRERVRARAGSSDRSRLPKVREEAIDDLAADLVQPKPSECRDQMPSNVDLLLANRRGPIPGGRRVGLQPLLVDEFRE